MTTTQGLILRIGELVNLLIAIVAGIALLVFFWGLVKFIFRLGGDEKAVDAGKKLMIWGVVALFVMVTVWGIVGFIQRGLGLPAQTYDIPWDKIPFRTY